MKCFTDPAPNRARPLLISALLLIGGSGFLCACPFCKEALAANSGLAKGFYWSILLMLGVPAGVVAVISMVVWRALRKGSVGDAQS